MLSTDTSQSNTVQTAVQTSAEMFDFTVDQQGAIEHFINSQNGTLPTAIRELLMNAIDARSKSCEIMLTDRYFSVRDFGKGFIDKEEISLKFGHFAQNRDNSESIYARFRIGRGQCMSLAKMSWRSNTFLIETDIKQHKNGYKLTSGLPMDPGCFVEGYLYKTINTWELERMIEEISMMFKYALIPVTLNGVLITPVIPDRYWDVDTPEFSIKYNPTRNDGVHLFNLGVFVRALRYEHYGFNADVVSKVPLTLNMARNELHETDAVFPKIAKILKEKAIAVAKAKQKSQKLDEISRRNMIQLFLAGEISFDDLRDFSVLRDCRGHYVKLNSLWNSKIPLTIAEDGFDRVADTLATRRVAQVLHPEEARLWRCENAQGLLAAVLSRIPHDRDHSFYRNKLNARATAFFAVLAMGIKSTHTVSDTKSLSPSQRATINALNYASGVMSKRLGNRQIDYLDINDNVSLPVRKIVPGVSDTASAWTDGSSMIAINENLLDLPQKGMWGAIFLCHLLLHEYSHFEPNLEGHDHDFSFYQRYHDATLGNSQHEILGHTISSFLGRYVVQCQKNSVPIPSCMATEGSGRRFMKYKLHLNGNRGLSEFQQSLLKAAGLQIAKRGHVWELNFNGYRTEYGDSKRGVTKFLDSILSSEGLPTLSSLNVPDVVEYMGLDVQSHVSFMEASAVRKVLLREKSRELLLQLSEKTNIPALYVDLVRPSFEDSYMYSLPDSRYAEFCLGLVCADPSNDALYFDADVQMSMIRFGNAHAVMNLSWSEASRAGVYRKEMSTPKIANDQAAIQLAVLKKMGNLLNDITDVKMREQFIQSFIPDKLALAMGVMPDPKDTDTSE